MFVITSSCSPSSVETAASQAFFIRPQLLPA